MSVVSLKEKEVTINRAKKRKIDWIIYFMTIPAVILFASFHTLPVLKGIYYSFTNWDGLSRDYSFVGFKNYINLIGDKNVWNSYIFTFKFALVATIIVNVISLLLAIGLNSKIKFKNFLRAVYFLPNVLSILIIGFIFNYIFSYAVPSIGEKLGIEILKSNILGNPKLAWIGVVIVAVWQACALNTVLYISGLQTVPEELYEAASLDGANKFQEFWHVTFPVIAPFFTINMVLAMKNFLMVFDHVMSLTSGGPGRATESISLLIYRSGFAGGEFAYQSANSVVYFIFIVIISIIQIRILQKREMDM